MIARAQGLFPLPDGDRLQLALLGSNPFFNTALYAA
jgi:hypothetical protein